MKLQQIILVAVGFALVLVVAQGRAYWLRCMEAVVTSLDWLRCMETSGLGFVASYGGEQVGLVV